MNLVLLDIDMYRKLELEVGIGIDRRVVGIGVLVTDKVGLVEL